MTRLSLIIYCLFFVYLGGCIWQGDLISEIKKLEKPKGGKHIRVDSVVEKYVPLGSSKAESESILKNQYFTLLEDRKVESDVDFKSCDDVLVGVYRIYKLPWPIYAYKVAVRICFHEERVTLIKAYYGHHTY